MRRLAKFVVIFSLVLILGTVFVERVRIHEFIRSLSEPPLPPAVAFHPSATSGVNASDPSPSPFETGYSTSPHYILETAPPTKTPPRDQLVFAGNLPKDVNLAVPFISQAPLGNWGEPYQNTCEEASALMLDYFFRGQTEKPSAESVDAALKKIVAYENQTFGDYKDTTAEQTAVLLRTYFGYKTVIVKTFDSADDLKSVLALGYPVIVPAAGKLLENPYFKNGGPAYHMLVIRGYTANRFISNDPGTRTKGEAFTYSYDNLLKAAHDWTGREETVTQGARKMIVVIP